MKAVITLGLLCLLSSALAFQNAEAETNDIEEGEGRSSSRPVEYDTSFLDEILSPDYFEDNGKDTTTETETTDNTEPEIVTKRAFCTGCETDISKVEDPKLKEIANFALQTYTTDTDGDKPLRFIRVIKAKTQVVAGVKYKLQVEAGYLNCTKAKYASNPEDCAINEEVPTSVCDFEVVEQAWRGSKEVVSSSCREFIAEEAVEDDDSDKSTTTGYSEVYEIEGDADASRRKKRDTQAVGKLRQADENLKDLEEMAKFALEQLDTIDEDNEARVLVDVLNVKKQTVSGWLYHMKLRVAQTTCSEGKNVTLDQCRDKLRLPFLICDVKVLFQPWQTVQKKVTESQCFPEKMKASKKLAKKLFGDDFKKSNFKIRKEDKDPAKMVGAPKEVDPKSPEILSLMDWAVETVDEQSNALHAQKLVQVVHAERQLVNGILNKVTFETGYTQCRKNSVLDRSACQLDEKREHNFCEMHIWEKPWLQEKRVTYSKCGKREEILKRKKRSLIGGDDHDYQPHKKGPLIGGDDHDYQPHKKAPLIGGDDHDYQPHKKASLIGGDDHDYQSHKKSLIGGDDHDYQTHNKRPQIGGDDHDYQAHEVGQFEEFRNKFGKKYSSREEYKYRLGVFRENMKKVKLLQDSEQGTATYGATMFADLTEEEFSQQYLGLRPDLRQKSKRKVAKIPQLKKLPEEFDWRHYNAVTPVKNQGTCGSCWAFSVTGNIEGLYARKYQTLVSFSEQELVDCDSLDEGCGGGLPENAYKSIQKLGGLETEQAYPYDGRNEKCHFKSDLAKAQVTGFVEIPKNETEMAAWLVKNGPISIGINANAMQFYFGGVSHPWKFLCSPKQLDHGVLVVGYGVHTTSVRHKIMPYWLVKNSWGPHWGEQGYYRVYRGDGTCGLNQMATSAVIA